MEGRVVVTLIILINLVSISAAFAQQCGSQAGGKVCPDGRCCSQYGYCGSTNNYCGNGCQSQCSGGGGRDDDDETELGQLITASMFDEILSHRDYPACPGHGFYTYDALLSAAKSFPDFATTATWDNTTRNAFISAAKSFPGFATTGDNTTRKREIAGFLAQTSHETTGGWPDAPGGPYSWGYCYVVKQGHHQRNCVPSYRWPCARGKSYYGRGPIQLSFNYNYGKAGEALGYDLLNNPDLLETDPTVSFETAIWYWMTPQSPKPSSHDVMVGKWRPSRNDVAAGRLPGYGMVTNIMNGDVECGHGYDRRAANRIGFFKRYCDMLGIDYGNNVDCYNQAPYGGGWLGNVSATSGNADEAAE